MTKPGLLPEGFHDRLPPFADAAAAVEARVLEAARRHGYERVDRRSPSSPTNWPHG